jgi:predicted DNA-binding transcriptional regulator AlpA
MQQIELTRAKTIPATQVYLSAGQVSARYGLTSDKNAWRWAKADPTFPKPVKLAPRCVRWKLSELEAWEATKLEAA